MRSIVAIIIFSLFNFSAYTQRIGSIDKNDLIDLMDNRNESTTYVINFWATWCSPCVDEIDYFEQLHRDFEKEVQVILVNLDFPNQVNTRVIPFIEDKNITAKVLNMTDLDYNEWIPEVDSEWSGAIPATLIYKGEKRHFIRGEVTKDALYSHFKSIAGLN